MIVENILIYEDIHYRNFLPLTYMRPVYDLTTGLSTILSKITHLFPEAVINLHCRDYLKNVTKQNHPGISVNKINTGVNLLLLNGRLLPDDDFKLRLNADNKLFLDQYNEVVGLFLNRQNTGPIVEMLNDKLSSKDLINRFRNKVKVETINAKLLEYPWELINENKAQVFYDFQRLNLSGIIKSEVPASTQTRKEHFIYVGRNTEFSDFNILDATQGPIYIGDDCHVDAFTSIKGPAYIGKGSSIKGNISNVSIGPASQVSGNINNSIFGGHVQIDNVSGIGYSYLSDGSWIADNSRNEYINNNAERNVDIYLDGYQIETEEKYLGLFTGDYARIPFNNFIPSGSVVGVASELALNSIAPRFTPSFIQYGVSSYKEKNLQKATDEIELFLKNKDLEFTSTEKDTLKAVYSFPEKKISNLIE